MSRVLIVDDEPQLLRALGINLRAARYEVAVAPTGADALRVAADFLPDLLLLDLGLPDMEGTDVVTELRRWTQVPILVLSGRTDSMDKVEALDAGADDYVTKPFGMEELFARMRAMLRRSSDRDEQPVVAFGDVTANLAARSVSRGGVDVRLTPTEWHLLEVLLRNPGRLMSQRQLLLEVWGPGYETAQGNLRLYMGQLRKKLEGDPARPVYFVNEPGLGYRFVA